MKTRVYAGARSPGSGNRNRCDCSIHGGRLAWLCRRTLGINVTDEDSAKRREVVWCRKAEWRPPWEAISVDSRQSAVSKAYSHVVQMNVALHLAIIEGACFLVNLGLVRHAVRPWRCIDRQKSRSDILVSGSKDECCSADQDRMRASKRHPTVDMSYLQVSRLLS